MASILVLDNYDSFTYNLVQIIGALCADDYDLEVVRNDKIDLAGIVAREPSLVVVSPGPGRPEDAGISVDVMGSTELKAPRLGVCLGHQALACAFGATVSRAPRLLHGKTSSVYHDGKGVFQGITNPLVATRYHSLVVEEETLNDDLVITAWTSHGEIMGLRHKERPLYGVQFHPESLETREGVKLLRNFIDQA
ncbi:MAG TPA: aminodeoxychorismate/anthranilate synthase component II [Phycisphaerales bacterium]|nr:aminodeoxychorismate/anthranilate synthase component II [Phycisphaerales bacterium]